jgi:hypothetical protein
MATVENSEVRRLLEDVDDLPSRVPVREAVRHSIATPRINAPQTKPTKARRSEPDSPSKSGDVRILSIGVVEIQKTTPA